MADEVKVYDWDDEIENDGEEREYLTLEEGDYEFEVTKFERGNYTPSDKAKTPACNQAIMTLKVATDDGDAYIVDRFPLASTMEWKISAFFRAIGLKKHGEPVKMMWKDSIGCKGRAHITKTKGNSENKDIYFNNVGKYIDPPAKGDDDEWS